MKKLITIAVLLSLNISLFAQQKQLTTEDVIYTNPCMGSFYNNPETNITIGFIQKTNTKLLAKCKIRVINSEGMVIPGSIVHPRGRSIIIFKPNERFNPFSKYNVQLVFDNNIFYHFDFHTNDKSNAGIINNENKTYSFPNQLIDEIDNKKARDYRELNNLPDGFPAFEIINSNHPGSGYYFLNRMSQNPEIKEYMIILDTLGFPVYYQEMLNGHRCYNFTMQETGYPTYWDQTDTVFHQLDSSYNITQSYMAKNGYETDGHELEVRNDSSYWVLIYDSRIIDMSEIVPGGQENALVTGLVIQHIDAEGDVLFEWKSWDHFEITDADPELVTLTSTGVDYVHGNALDVDTDGNIVISSRNMSEITKIDASSGDIIWRWGGTQNQFEFIDDTTRFSGQHNIRSLGNNVYSIYDNGNTRLPRFSRGLYYELDTEEMTATLITDINHIDSSVFSPFMGSFFTSEDNERLMGWSFNFQRYIISEYDSLENILFEMRSIDTAEFMSYKAEKHNWKTNAISFNDDEIFIDEVSIFDTVYIECVVNNNQSTSFNLNGFNTSDSAFQLLDELPIEIPSGLATNLTLSFIPSEERSYSAAISLYTDNQQFRNAKQFRISTSIVAGVNEKNIDLPGIRVTPNPTNGFVNISGIRNIKISGVSVYSLFGQQMANKYSTESTNFYLDLSNLQSGIYFLKIETNAGILTRRIIKN